MKTTKKLIALLLAAVLTFSIPLPAAAAEVASGNCGDAVSWILTDDGILTISGTGAMRNTRWTSPWEYYKKSVREVRIGDGVTEICKSAFSGLSALEKVSLPATLVKIDGYAFKDCEKLTVLELPDSVTTLGEFVFYGCTGLTQFRLPQGVTQIPSGCFAYCLGLTQIDIPENVTTICSDAFRRCDGITSISIPANITDIQTGAFAQTYNVTAFTVDPANTVYYSDAYGAVYNREKKTLCKVPEPFTGVYKIQEGTVEINDSAFYGCTKMTGVEIPDSVTNIGFMTFTNCRSLEQIELPEGISIIGPQTFTNCVSLTEITIPESVKNLGQRAFMNCSSLKRITIPGGVYSVMMNCFENCTALTEVIIESGVKVVGNSAFANCTALDTVVLPDTLTTIDSFAFSNCSALTELHLPEGLKSIEGHAFENAALTTVKLPDSLQSIGSSAFKGCKALTSAELGSGVTEIKIAAFAGCTGLTEITIPAQVSFVDCGVFRGCGSLERIQVDPANENYTADASGVLYTKDMSMLVAAPGRLAGEYAVAQGVKTIEWDAFRDCSLLTGVTVPASVEEIRDDAFNSCGSLEWIRVDAENANYASDAAGALYTKDMTVLLAVPGAASGDYTVAQSVTEIGVSAFYGCTGLSSISIPAGVTEIGNRAFSYCTTLKSFQVDEGNTVYESDENHMLYKKNERTLIAVPGGMSGTVVVDEDVASIKNAFVGNASVTAVIIRSARPDIISDFAFTACPNLEYILFTGNAPSTFPDYDVKALCYYPKGNDTWSANSYSGYFGNSGYAQWHAYTLEVDAETGRERYILDRGSCGAEAAWTLEVDGTLTVSGSGDMQFDLARGVIPAPWGGYKEMITSVVIEEGITGIGASAFAECPKLGSVTIAGSVKLVGDSAFAGCTALTDVEFLGDAPVVEAGCFQGVSATVHVPAMNATWTEAVLQGAGGNMTVVADGVHTHSYQSETREPTCTEDGETVHTCACGDTYTEVLKATGHQEVVDAGKAADCTQAGLTEGKHCSVCEEVTVKQEKLPALGHAYAEGVCTRCGAEEKTFTLGDVNGDGKINVTDAMVALRYAVKKITAQELVVEAADVNSDGKVNVTDAMQILRFAVKKITEFKPAK